MHCKRVTYLQLESKIMLTNWETHDIQTLINTPLYRFPKFLKIQP